MNNNKPLAAGVILLVVAAAVLAMLNRDALYVDAAVLFFVVAIAYAEWCKRL